MKNLLKAILLTSTSLIILPTSAEAGPIAGSILSAALATGGFAGFAFAPVAATGFFSTWFGSFLARVALGVALNALTPKPKTQGANRGYRVTTRGSALDHQVIYGKVRVGGVIVYDHTTGTNNKYLHRVIAFTGHEIESYEEVYINDEVVTLDGDGYVTSPDKYAGTLIRIKKHYGTADQVADTDLVTETSGEWSSAHRLRGIAYLYVRLAFDADKFPNGVPDITATIKGKKVYDPRTSTTAWSDNPALCIRDYILSDYGLNENSSYVDDTLVQAAANVCDETDTLDSSTRYTCNGAFITATTPYDILGDLLTSMGGTLWYAQGKWRMKAAAWTTPALALTEDDLRSNIQIQTRHSRRDNFNTVRGTFRGEESNWQVTDYPEVTSSAYLSADNNQESVIDFDLPFTDTSGEARRLARIFLERNRQQLTVNANFGLRGFSVQVGDNVTLTNSRMGWTNKEFEVTAWTFQIVENYEMQVQMTLRETAESIFDEVDDGVTYEADNTTLLSPFEVPNIGFALSSELVIFREKLTNFLYVDVSAPSVLIDRVEVQFKQSSNGNWTSVGIGDPGRFEIIDLEDGLYDVRVRGINTFGVRGEWSTRSSYPLEGLAQPPSDVQNFYAEVNGPTINLFWDAVTDLDLSYYKIRFSPDTSSGSWANSLTYVPKVARPSTSVAVPAKAGLYLIRAYDKSGIGSENTTSLIVAENDLEQFTTTLTQTEDPTFSGTKTNCEVVDGELRKATIDLFDSLSGNIDDLEGQWDSLGLDYTGTEATYEFSDYIDTGSSRRCRVTLDAYSIRFDGSAGLWDDLKGNLDNLTGLWDDLIGGAAAANFDDTNIIAYVSTTDDDPSGTPTWSAYRPVRVADIYARAFRFKIEFLSEEGGVTPSISQLSAKVEYN